MIDATWLNRGISVSPSVEPLPSSSSIRMIKLNAFPRIFDMFSQYGDFDQLV
jgi:hypothetical protein